MSTPSASPVEETLAWESEFRSRTVLASIVGGFLVLAGGVALAIVLHGLPRTGVLDAIRAAAGQPLSVGPGLRTAQLQFYDNRAAGLLATYVVQGFGAILTAATLGYLFRATKARRPELPRAALYGAVVGPVMLGISLIAQGVAFAIEVHHFISKHDLSTKAAHDALNGGVLLGTQVLHTAASLAVAFAFVLVSINAMRVGVITRFMGVLGAIVGALFVLPLGSSFLVQSFWMISFGLMLLGRLPSGIPPAWEAGVAVPWPTQQELREQRGEVQAPKTPAKSPPAAAGDVDGEAAPKTVAHSSSKKRKRKHR